MKISAPYRSSAFAPGYPDVRPIAMAMVAANPLGIPLPGQNNSEIMLFFQIDDGCVLNLLPRWVPDANVRKTVLVDNPSRLYGF